MRLEPFEDRRRVGHDLVIGDEHGDCCECDSLDVGRKGNPVDVDQSQFFRLKNQSWPIVEKTITAHENA
jgi:hypothetical protein